MDDARYHRRLGRFILDRRAKTTKQKERKKERERKKEKQKKEGELNGFALPIGAETASQLTRKRNWPWKVDLIRGKGYAHRLKGDDEL